MNIQIFGSKKDFDSISIRRIQVLCTEGRIPGAMKIGSYWAIPADAEKRDDQRVKSGKYIKTKE